CAAAIHGNADRRTVRVQRRRAGGVPAEAPISVSLQEDLGPLPLENFLGRSRRIAARIQTTRGRARAAEPIVFECSNPAERLLAVLNGRCGLLRPAARRGSKYVSRCCRSASLVTGNGSRLLNRHVSGPCCAENDFLFSDLV